MPPQQPPAPQRDREQQDLPALGVLNTPAMEQDDEQQLDVEMWVECELVTSGEPVCTWETNQVIPAGAATDARSDTSG
ncbi:hypothetical protein AV530_009679 [Patagioenas fasciata monilis]|uniref:Uncharacterized protein n=1 Tax=Patagioenas fasciata monilis TaxID=372326 RepID=A0A1V4KA15_PATFA|nr:hypothetical protein AV530_009679 [Patagioenas fasciata monilis]